MTPTKRDFDVEVDDKKGHKVHFHAREAIIAEKTLATRLGVGDVKETIHAKSFTVKETKGAG